VRFEKKIDYVGGAGVVAKHLSAAGADVTFSTVLGDDSYKSFVLNDLSATGVNCLPVIDNTRPTTNKNAVVAETYRLLKIDTLDSRSISNKIVEVLQRQLAETVVDAVVFSDFRHGLFNPSTIEKLTASIPKGAFRVADSQVASRWGNILDVQGFDLITPNEREARFALGDQDSVLRPLALMLFKRSGCGTLMLKCGERGLITYRSIAPEDPRAFFNVDTFANRVIDSVGAGDALLAYATLAMVATKNEVIASILGNIAAGVECENEGNLPVTPESVKKKIDAIEKQVNYQI